MSAQALVVALLVVGCAVYAGWTLMPSVLRRGLAGRLLKWPLPRRLSNAVRKAATTPSACGCDGCDRSASPAVTESSAMPQVIRFHPPSRR